MYAEYYIVHIVILSVYVYECTFQYGIFPLGYCSIVVVFLFDRVRSSSAAIIIIMISINEMFF